MWYKGKYINAMKFPTKFPTIIGLILVMFVVGIVIFLTEGVFRSPSGASGSSQPTNVRITNVSDSSFTVSWITQAPTTGTTLVSSPGKSNQIYYDQRDAVGKLGTYTSHSIPIRDARPSTKYAIKLLSNGAQYTDGGQPYGAQTPDILPVNTNALEPAYGTLRTAVDQLADGALIYLTLEGGQELSTITKSSGLWLIPLNQVRTGDLTSFLPTVERMTETILVRFGDEETSATTDTLNDSPVPEMTMGKVYDFRRQQAKTAGNAPLALRPTPRAGPPSGVLPVGGAVLGQTSARTFSVSLTAPAQGSALTTTLPLIAGTGIPDKFVGISLGITQVIGGSAKVGANGLWSYTPARPLAPGKQSVTITSPNAQGKPVAITHAFEILKSGTQVLGDATPSATLTPEDTLSPTPVEVPTSTLAGEPVPTSGNELPVIILLLIGMAFLASGAVVAIR